MYLTTIYPELVPQVSTSLLSNSSSQADYLLILILSVRYLQTIDSSPPYANQSGTSIHCAAGIFPKVGGLAPSIIDYNAPKTTSLLHGQTCEPIPTKIGKRKITKQSAADSSAVKPPIAKKKASKKQKIAVVDDLPTLDSVVEEFLGHEEMDEAVDEVATDISDSRETMQTPSADTPSPQKMPSTPKHQTLKAPVHIPPSLFIFQY